MDADSLRQITDAIYYVAHVCKIICTVIILGIGWVGLMILIDTTRIESHLKKLAAKENQ